MKRCQKIMGTLGMDALLLLLLWLLWLLWTRGERSRNVYVNTALR